MKLNRIILSFVFLLQAAFVFSQNNAANTTNTGRANSAEEKNYPRTAPVYYKDAKVSEVNEGDKYAMRTVGNSNTNTLPRTSPVQANSAEDNSATNLNLQGTKSSTGNKQPATTGRTAPLFFNNTKPSK